MIEVQVKGIETVILKTNVKRLLTGIKTGMKKSLVHLHRIGVKNTPVDTGILRKGYREKYSGLRAKMYNRTAYAKFIEDGTKFIKPRHFLQDIKDRSEDKIDTILNSEIRKQLG